jgi:hypothetical protein
MCKLTSFNTYIIKLHLTRDTRFKKNTTHTFEDGACALEVARVRVSFASELSSCISNRRMKLKLLSGQKEQIAGPATPNNPEFRPLKRLFLL